jgi:dynein heavy chain
MKHIELCTEVGETASKEYNIEMMLREMQSKWKEINFDLVKYKTSMIIRGADGKFFFKFR